VKLPTTVSDVSVKTTGLGVYHACAAKCFPVVSLEATRAECTKGCLEEVNYYFKGRLGFYGGNVVPGHTNWHAGGTSYYYIASCALYKSMVLWKCTNGTDVRGKSCVVGGHHVDRLGTTTKTIRCYDFSTAVNYGVKGSSFTEGEYTGCQALGANQLFRTALDCPQIPAANLTLEQINACASKVCMKVGGVY